MSSPGEELETAIVATFEDAEPLEPIDDQGPVLYRKPENAIEDMTWNPESAVLALKGMPLAISGERGQRTPTLFYDIPYSSESGSVAVRGPSATLLRALVSQRGNFETMGVSITQGVQLIPEVGRDGERHIEEIPSIRAEVRVRDLRNNNVTVGVFTEPLFGRKKGGSWFARPQAERNAISKALRNARAEHFAAVLPLIMQVLVREFTSGLEVVQGKLPDAVVAGANIAVRERDERDLRAGETAERAFYAEAREIESQLDVKQLRSFRNDWSRAKPILCSGMPLRDAPQKCLERCREWLERKRAELGVRSPASDMPNERADGNADDEYLPSEEEVRELLKSLDARAREKVFAESGMRPEDTMDPSSASIIWRLANIALESSTTP